MGTIVQTLYQTPTLLLNAARGAGRGSGPGAGPGIFGALGRLLGGHSMSSGSGQAGGPIPEEYGGFAQDPLGIATDKELDANFDVSKLPWPAFDEKTTI